MGAKRQFLIQAAATPLLAVLGHALAAGKHPLPNGIRSLRGAVWVNDAPAHVNQVVLPGDAVRTGARSEVVYVMGNNAYLMRDDTAVRFASDGAVGVLRIITGKVLAVFGPGAKRIETATATVGIRGTACYIESGESQMYLCLCYGNADIRPLADPEQTQTLRTRYHDKPLTIGTDTAQPLLQAAPVRDHSDAELTLLEATVGRVPPFQGFEGHIGY
jgi:hypothetical protein